MFSIIAFTKLWTFQQFSAFHQTFEVIGHGLGIDCAFHTFNNQVCRFSPTAYGAASSQRREWYEPGFTLSWPAYFGAVPWVASNRAHSSPMFTPGAIPIPPTCAARASGNVVTVQVHTGDNIILRAGRSGICCRNASAITSLIDNLFAGVRVFNFQPRASRRSVHRQTLHAPAGSPSL